MASASHPAPAAVETRASWLAAAIAHRVLDFTRIPGANGLFARRGRRVLGRGAVPFDAATPDGERLAAIYVPPRVGADSPARLPVLYAHGWIETWDRHAARAAALARVGHGVVLFDHRGHGRSTGRGTTLGARERGDAAAVLDEAQRRGLVGPRVINLGYSLGGAVALQHAAADPRVAGVVALAPFLTALDAIRSYRRLYAPFLPEAWVLRGFSAAAAARGFSLADSSTLEAATRLRAPVLLIAGARDRHLGAANHAGPLRDALRGGRDAAGCQLLEIPRATHFNLSRGAWPEMERAILGFCASLSE